LDYMLLCISHPIKCWSYQKSELKLQETFIYMKTQYFWDMFVSNAGGQGGHTSNRGLMATNEAGS